MRGGGSKAVWNFPKIHPIWWRHPSITEPYPTLEVIKSTIIWWYHMHATIAIIKICNIIFQKCGGSKAVGNFSENSSDLVAWPFPQLYQRLSLYLMGKMHSEKLFGCLFCRSYDRTSKAACPQGLRGGGGLQIMWSLHLSHWLLWSSPHPTLVMD